jgi:hypothetical protein
MGPLHALELRRVALVHRCGQQRAALAVAASPFTSKLAMADRVGTSLRAHPVIAAFGAGALAWLGGRRLVRLALRALTVLSFARRLL